jgi:hypothetical protein
MSPPRKRTGLTSTTVIIAISCFVIGSAVSYNAVAASPPLAAGKPSIRELNYSGKTLLLHIAGYLIDWTPRRLQPDRLARWSNEELQAWTPQDEPVRRAATVCIDGAGARLLVEAPQPARRRLKPTPSMVRRAVQQLQLRTRRHQRRLRPMGRKPPLRRPRPVASCQMRASSDLLTHSRMRA